MRSLLVGHPLRARIAPALALASILLVPASGIAQQVDPAVFAGMRWRSIGPNRSGYVAAPAGVPGDPTTYYVGLPEGGVWKSSNGGTTWEPIFDSEHVASVGAVVVAPSNHRVVYVGTGDRSGWSFTPGNGVYKSIDGGRTWTNIGLRGSSYVSAIVVDPRNPDIVLVAALGGAPGPNTASGRGLFRSIDGGRNWHQVLGGDSGGAADLSDDYSDPAVIYAVLQRGFGGRGGGGAGRSGGRGGPVAAPRGTGVYKSINEGVTWTEVSGKGLPDGAAGFAIAEASGTRGRRVYAEVRSAGGPGTAAIGLYRTDDGGLSWVLETTHVASAGGKIYADPQDPDVVYLAGTSLYRSTDGGRTVTAWLGAPSGDDIRFLWLDPTNHRRMIAGADQGPTISVDGGQSWTLWYTLMDGQFYRVSTDNDFPYHVCGPQQDSGTACVLSRSDFGEIRPDDWYPVGGFEDGFIVSDPLNSRYLYTQGWYHVLRRFDRVTSQVTVLYTPAPDDRFGGAPPLAFSPQDPHTLYMGAQYALASSDGARTWRHISPDLTITGNARTTAEETGVAAGTRGGTIQAMAPSPVAAGEIWVGTNTGVVQLTHDGGGTWINVTPPDVPSGGINVIDPSHSHDGTAYVAVLSRDSHPHIYRTSDFGAHWQEIVTGLPDDAVVRVVREDPVDPQLLYAGTVTGAFVSFDRGDHWQSLQRNLPTTVVSDLTIHGADLIASTYGRGFWILDDVTPLRQAQQARAAEAAYLFRPDTASRIRWDNTQDTPLPKETPTGKNPPEGAILDYYLAKPATGPIELSIVDAAGHVVRTYSDVAPMADTLMPNVPAYWIQPPIVLSRQPGMHRIAWDLRYETPDALPFGYYGTLLNYTEYTLNWHAIPGETPQRQPVGPMALPGSYTVRLTVNGNTYSQPLTVVPDPRVPVTEQGLARQLALEQRMTAGLHSSAEGFRHIEELRSALASVATATGAIPAVRAAAATLDTAVERLANGPGSFAFANRDLARELTDMIVGDIDPSPSVMAAPERSCRDITTDREAFVHLQETQLAALEKLLNDAGRTPLPHWTPDAGSACA
jgi:photosystem II stability/assembly factor-like uncharacterized protein